MTAARTTVVVATRNRCAELLRTLGKLAALRPRPPVIVLDNDSTDATVPAVTAAAESLGGIELVRLSHNAGATARNVGVERADTPYVAFSDDDSWWAADALARAERLFDAHPTLGLLAARTLVGPDEHEDPVSTQMARSPLGHDPGLPGPSVLGFLACSAVVRRGAFLDAGGFSAVLHFAGEETLLAYDLAAAGWQLCYVDGVRAHHHPSLVRGDRLQRDVRQLRNHTLVTWMRRPAPVAVRTGLGLLRQTLRYPPAGLAVAAALARLPMALARRHRLPDEVEERIRVLDAAP
ncbi:glycosyltransferase family 2 protein [Actinophytocola sp.]|uniref:glycosyltransferase family 2 protein n=1 Tax=Actinophytocola sp. TaxID=1872138 RepID=UPI002ED8C8CD